MPTRTAVDGLFSAQDWTDDRAQLAHTGAAQTVAFLGGAADHALARAPAATAVYLLAPHLPGRALIEYKLAAARSLPLQSVRSALGIGFFGRRVWFYHFLRPQLSAGARSFWDQHEREIRAGLLQCGHVEQVMARWRRWGLGAADLPIGADCAAQARWWETRSVRARLSLATIQRRYGGMLAERLPEILASTPLSDNPFLQWALTGTWADPEQGLPWLRADAWPAIPQALSRVKLVDALPAGLDSIYLHPDAGDDWLPRAADALRAGGTLCWWSQRPAPRVPALSWQSHAPNDRVGWFRFLHVGTRR